MSPRWLVGNYRLLLTAFFVSTAGDWLYRLALPLLVLQMTGSALTTALVYSLEYLPYLLFAPFAGVVADRADRRVLMISTDLGAAVIVGLLAVLVWQDTQRVWMVYLAAFVLSASRPLYHAAFQGVIPRLVPPDRLVWANSRLQATQSVLDLAGPVLGAGAVAALGAGWALGLDSASFTGSAIAIVLISMARAVRPDESRDGVVESLRAGVAFLRGSPTLLWGSALTAGSAFALLLVEANMIYYLVEFRHQPVVAVGVVFAALGAGSIVGALATPKLSRHLGPGQLIIYCMLGGGLATSLLIFVTPLVGIALVWVLVGASTAIFTVTFYTLRHQLTPNELFGRILTLTRLMAFSALPVAPLVGGALLGATGKFTVLIAVSAAVQIGVGILALGTPLRGATGVPEPVSSVPDDGPNG
ncbi:MAG: hypothetical protein V7637_2318 [Mycobacteriales bacterium]